MNIPYDSQQMQRVFAPAPAATAEPLTPLRPDPHFEDLLSRSGTWCYSVDYRSGRYRYVSPGIERMLGYDREAWKFGGLDSVFRYLLPEDAECLRQLHLAILQEVRRAPAARRCDLTFVYTCRMRAADGRTVHLSHQQVFPDCDAAGTPITNFTVVSDITALKAKTGCLLHVKERTATGERPVRTTVFRCQASVNFSRRELEVLELVGEGLSSQQIARKLFISYNTVCTHRKNLLRKAGVGGTVELLTFARDIGLVE